MVEVMKTMVTAFKRSHAGTFTPVPPILQQATTNLCLHQRLLDPHGQVWVPAPFSWSWCTQDSVCALQESVSQSCVSSGGIMVGLMVTPPRGLMPYPTLLCPELWPLWQSIADLSPQVTLKHSSVSVSLESLGPGVHKVCLSSLSISGGYGLDSKLNFV